MNKRIKILLIIFGALLLILVATYYFGYIINTNLHTDKKPAIYLYPTEDTRISVKLIVNGTISKDIPKYPKDGWDVFTTKEGLIDNQYDYLFYEAKLNELELPEDGWIVAYTDLDNWFEINLKQFGLNQKETSQFKEYWLKELPKSNYYEIRLLSKDFINKNMQLIIDPTPDTIIRIQFYFRPIKELKEIQNPIIIKSTRKGFTVVEWGGILDN